MEAASKNNKTIAAHRVASVLNSKRYKYLSHNGLPYATYKGSRGIYKTITSAWKAMTAARRHAEAAAIADWIVNQYGEPAWRR
ncbi:hypothetical protein MKK69_25815 [Methylobacterium sp. J-026]|uniref:hypothetical protein n=1 Tax=Methylobacterium sp. J-026 TaxID=2836624 RepID=UPI001FB8FCF1|nr:hypothetical protein [Methylobacterium sp. J-026]MCJ2137418.1 hypothetical protein [Methylobacterium sp. J-026]